MRPSAIPAPTGARDPSLRRAGCLDHRDERIDPGAMSYNWRMKATSAAFSRSVSCTPRTRLKNSTVSSSVKRRRVLDPPTGEGLDGALSVDPLIVDRARLVDPE